MTSVPRLGVRSCQNSFATEDSEALLEYRQDAHKAMPGVMCDLLDAAVSDATWLQQWKDQLDGAAAVLIIFSDAYRRKITDNPKDKT